MKSVQRVELGIGSVTAVLPDGLSYDVEEDGSLIAWMDEDPEALALRISCITLVPKDENVQPVTEVIAEEAANHGLKAIRTGDKVYFISEECSTEEGETYWLRFWHAAYLNFTFIISVCCAESDRESRQVATASRMVIKIIESLAKRPEHSELTERELHGLEEQRQVVRDVLQSRYDVFTLPTLRADLPVLQQLIEDRAFSPEQEYEWSSVGVVFGDVLASELGLDWCAYCDEQGAEPALRLGESSITLYPRSMILKRIERGDEMELDAFIDNLAESIEQLKAEGC